MSVCNLPLIVLSTDSFSDTWALFFRKFDLYFPGFSGKKYLVTESRKFLHENVITINTNIFSTINWTDSLYFALDYIKSPEVFLMLDDFILTDAVNDNFFKEALNYFKSEKLDFLSISAHEVARLHTRSIGDESFLPVKRFSKYRINTSPGFWQTYTLKKYLSKSLNPWQFEIFGTMRSYLRSDKIYMLNKVKYNLNYDPFPYFINHHSDTAIVRGKWQSNIKDVFPDEISLFEERGIWSKNEVIKSRIFSKLLVNPFSILRYIIGL